MEINLELQKATVDTINVYCRVLELHVKTVAEGANPITSGPMKEILAMAGKGLHAELGLLRSLRNGLIDKDDETD